MCIVQTPDPGARQVENDAIPAATDLELGQVGRGAAGLGRLKLRGNQAGGGTTTARSTGQSAGDNPLALPVDAAGGGSGQTDVGVSPYRRTPNDSLRLPVEP